MAASLTTAPNISAVNRAADVTKEGSASVPWYIWCAVLAITSAIVGGHWDISWHSSIGRDTFWTPAHMAIYLCGVLAGIAFGYIILSTTFSKNAPLAASSVHIWGFRAPLGAFIASWGGIAMLTSAPFDNWWHDAYGLDVKIVSPPHILLFVGIYGVLFGTLVLIAGHMNRASEHNRQVSRRLFLYVAGIGLVMTMVLLMEFASRTNLHTALPYILMGALTPIAMTVSSRTTSVKYSATVVAGIYTLFLIALIQILPLFPAEPKLGPVYQHVTQFIPPEFPILLIVPALALDLFWSRTRIRSVWILAAASAAIYMALLICAEWPFASFLMSPAARNSFFGTGYLYYGLPPNTYLARNEFVPATAFELIRGLIFAIAACTLTIRWSFVRGEWMRSLRR